MTHSLRASRSALVALSLTLTVQACAPVDADELSGDALATDLDELRSRCGGPFNCRLDNPTSDNANRFDNPATGENLWPVDGHPLVVDGFGGSMGALRSSGVKINFGQRKRIAGIDHIYAFNVITADGSRSGWIPEASVRSPAISAMPTADARDSGRGFYDTPYVITGGSPASFGDLRVLPNMCDATQSIRATDYTARWGHWLHLQYALPGYGGVATDTVPLGAGFRRARGVATVTVDLFGFCSSRKVGEMHFVYGATDGRFGWVAREVLSVGVATVTPPVNTGNLGATRSVLRVCEALCRDRGAYHEVPGVDSECTDHARAFCTIRNRGGLQDARWRQPA